jgi:activator of 2-hydroxyglutaryl-CoA dehydratase
MKTLGICCGSTTIQYVVVDRDDAGSIIVGSSDRLAHEGNPRRALIEILTHRLPRGLDRVAVTGRRFLSAVALTSITEPEAVESACGREYAGRAFPEMVVSAGGETLLAYKITPDGRIGSVHTGNKCASGTGEFFLQQVRRMGLSAGEAVSLAEQGMPHPIAGRCSVFCKSDCTHALNKGEPKANIAAGLCRMMADKIAGLVKEIPCERMALIGGGTRNRVMVGYLRERWPGLLVPTCGDAFEAYGAALWACA